MAYLKDKKIKIYKVEYVTDKIGNQKEVTTLLTGAPVWAYFRQIGGNEYYSARVADVTNEEVIFQVNWRNDYNTKMFVVYKGAVYDITRVDPYEGYKSDVKLYCKLNPTKKPPA